LFNLLVLRALLFIYLLNHALASYQDIVNKPLALALFTISYGWGWLVASRWQTKQAIWQNVSYLLSLPLFFETLRLGLWLVDRSMSQQVSLLLIEWDLTYKPITLILWYRFYSTLAFYRYRRYQYLEIGLIPLSFLIIFSQYPLNHYPSFIAFYTSITFYIIVQSIWLHQLALSLQQPKLQLAKPLIGSTVLAVWQLTLAIMLYPMLYRQATPQLRSSDGLLQSQHTYIDFADTLQLEAQVSLGNRLLFLIEASNLLPNTLLKRRTLRIYAPDVGFSYDAYWDELPVASAGVIQQWSLEVA